MKKGFTLAEVLITLAIIGVVAALTIPTVIANYQKKQFYTGFMKAYNVLQTAFNLSSVENGSPSAWVWENNQASFMKYIGNFLKVQAICKDDADKCGVSEGAIDTKYLNKTPGLGDYHTVLEALPFSLSLQDGSIIFGTYLEIDGVHVTHIAYDVNGAKGPNIGGRDVFTFWISKQGDDIKLYPLGVYDINYPFAGKTNTLSGITDSTESSFNCSTTITSEGAACGARLLLEGKMDY